MTNVITLQKIFFHVFFILFLSFFCDQLQAGFDPKLTWKTIHTRHFRIHYHHGEDHIALKTAHYAEESYLILERNFQWGPKDTIHIVVSDNSDSANGAATVFPYLQVNIFVVPPVNIPGLENFDNWLKMLLNHELTHIFHLDMVHGLNSIVKKVTGNYWCPNCVSPPWLIEGLATYEETMTTSKGRGRSSYLEMILRMSVLDNHFPKIDQLNRYYEDWPYGSSPYYYGVMFHLYLQKRFGHDAIVQFLHWYASMPVPFLLDRGAIKAFGKSFYELWNDWQKELKARYQREKIEREKRPLNNGDQLTYHQLELGDPIYFGDSEHIVFGVPSSTSASSLYILDTKKNISKKFGDIFSSHLSVDEHAKKLAYIKGDGGGKYNLYYNAYIYEISQKEKYRISFNNKTDEDDSSRASAVAISSDGTKVIVVQNSGGYQQIIMGNIIIPKKNSAAQKKHTITVFNTRILSPFNRHLFYGRPVFHPAMQQIAVPVSDEKGLQYIEIITFEGKIIQRIGYDPSLDLDPVFSKDGKYLYFVSDRSGISNLYTYNVSNHESYQITNVTGGVFNPAISDDNTKIAYRGYSKTGFDIFEIKLDISKWEKIYIPYLDKGEEPATLTLTATTSKESHDLSLHSEFPEFQIKDYNPYESLLPSSQNWNLIPLFFITETDVLLGGFHVGNDALLNHAYQVTAYYGSDTNSLGGSASYINKTIDPSLSLSGSSYVVSFPRRIITWDDPRTGHQYYNQNGNYLEQRKQISLGSGYLYKSKHSISSNYVLSQRDPLQKIPELVVIPALPPSGYFSKFAIGYGYGNAVMYKDSVMPEDGYSFGAAVELLSPWLLSSYTNVVASVSYIKYFSAPWGKNHSISTYITCATNLGPDYVETFRLGGSFGSSIFSGTTDKYHQLRGFPVAVFQGSGYTVASLEYAYPLYRVNRGLGNFPLFLSRFDMNFFFDMGKMFTPDELHGLVTQFYLPFYKDIFSTFSSGFGGEILIRMIIGWEVPITTRIGFAFGVNDPYGVGYSTSADAFYMVLGTFL